MMTDCTYGTKIKRFNLPKEFVEESPYWQQYSGGHYVLNYHRAKRFGFCKLYNSYDDGHGCPIGEHIEVYDLKDRYDKAEFLFISSFCW